MKIRLIAASFLCAVTVYGQGTQTPLYNAILQSDLNADGFKILTANFADYAGTGLTWNVSTNKFDVTGGGGSGTVTSITADFPITITPDPTTTTGMVGLDLATWINWDTAYADRLKWNGGATGLTAATGRTSLGLVIGTDVEAWLGNPSVTGYVLSSTTGGVRSWIAPPVGGGSGDVVGPASATDNAIVRYDGTTGKLVQNSLLQVADDGGISGATYWNIDTYGSYTTTGGNLVSTAGTVYAATQFASYSNGSKMQFISDGNVRFINNAATGFTTLQLGSDTAIGRTSAGAMEINNGTIGSYRDLKLRTLTHDGGQLIIGAGGSPFSIGALSTVAGAGDMAIGFSATATGQATVVGYGASGMGNDVIMGVSAAGGGNSIVIGKQATAASLSFALGSLANASGSGSTAMGYSSVADTANIFVAGGSIIPINEVYFGKGRVNATPTAWSLNGTGGSGTDIAGADLKIAGGRGTGTGAGGSLLLQTAAAGSTSASLNTLTTRLTIDSTGVSTFAGDAIVPDEVYGAGWDGSLEVPTKNALYDKIQTLSAGGGAPTTVDYLVGTADATLSNEIVVGLSPGGELGGTWASPTLDDSVTVASWTLTTPTIAAISNLTSDGFVKTSGGIGTLSIDTSTYLTTATAASTYQPLDGDLTELAAITGTQGDVIYHNGTDWVDLGPGTNGNQLTTHGAGANPTWDVPGTGGGAAWGSISGTLTDQTDLDTELDGKQPLDSDLTTIAGLTATTDNFLIGVSSAWDSRTPAQARTTLGLVIGTNVQAWDTDLDTWATKTPYNGTVVVTTGKTFTSSNTLTLAGTDGSTLTIGGGGTLGTAAYTAASAYQVAGSYLTAANISDTAFAATWDAVTTIAPSKNVVYDILHTADTDDDGLVNKLDMGDGLVKVTSNVVGVAASGTDYLGTANISDTAFAASWDTVTTIAPSKNAVYDILHIADTDDDGAINKLDQGTGITNTNSTGVIQTAITAPAGAILGTTDTQTLTNKRITPRVTTITSNATLSPNGDTDDIYAVSALATAVTTISAPTGTPVDGQKLIIRVISDSSVRAISGWNAIYRFSTALPAPSTTVASTTHTWGFMYNSTAVKWDCLAIAANP